MMKKYWFLILIIVAIGVWILNGYADEQVKNCGLINFALDFEQAAYNSPPEIFYTKWQSIKNHIDDMLIQGNTHRLANEFRNIYGWGWFPPKDAQK